MKKPSPLQADTCSASNTEKDAASQGDSERALNLLKKVAGENISYLAGASATLLQIAHPRVGQGVADHSQFAGRVISRAQYTQMYIYTMIFGTPDEKAAMRYYVDKAHSRVKGGEGATTYNATDPELQLWVAITIYAALVGAYELMNGPLPPDEAELVFQAFSVMGTSLQVPRKMWPTNLLAYNVYWRDMVDNHLKVSPDARNVLEDLFHPKGLPLWIRPIVFVMMPLLVRPVAVEQLPPNIRTQFGLKSTRTSRALSSLFISTMASLNPFMPPFVRQSQKIYYMRLMRKRIARRGGQLVKP